MSDVKQPHRCAGGNGRPGGASRLKARVKRWLDSDLVGITATLYTFGVLVLGFVVFRVGGGVAGMIVIVAAWIPMVLFAIQGRNGPPGTLDLSAPGEGPRHRVLVIANQGLEDPALSAEVRRRSNRTATEVMILAPVVASSPLRELADDVDPELDRARQRLGATLRNLRREGIAVSGRADIADPMESLLDGLRQFPPNEVLMLPDREADWDSAADLAERVRTEIGLPVTALGPFPATASDSPG